MTATIGILCFCAAVIGVIILRCATRPRIIRNRKWIVRATVIAAIACVALSGQKSIVGAALPVCAVIGGLVFGLSRRGAEGGFPIKMTTILFWGIGASIILQPEFYHIGQMGFLPVVDKILLAVVAALTPAIGAVRIWARADRTRFWLSPKNHKYAVGALRFGFIATVILFLATESILMFGAVSAASLVLVVARARHLSGETASRARGADYGLWCMQMAVIGALVQIPLLVIIAILLWRAHPTNIKTIKQIF